MLFPVLLIHLASLFYLDCKFPKRPHLWWQSGSCSWCSSNPLSSHEIHVGVVTDRKTNLWYSKISVFHCPVPLALWHLQAFHLIIYFLILDVAKLRRCWGERNILFPLCWKDLNKIFLQIWNLLCGNLRDWVLKMAPLLFLSMSQNIY